MSQQIAAHFRVCALRPFRRVAPLLLLPACGEKIGIKGPFQRLGLAVFDLPTAVSPPPNDACALSSVTSGGGREGGSLVPVAGTPYPIHPVPFAVRPLQGGGKTKRMGAMHMTRQRASTDATGGRHWGSIG
jgi:hypothetical protein